MFVLTLEKSPSTPVDGRLILILSVIFCAATATNLITKSFFFKISYRFCHRKGPYVGFSRSLHATAAGLVEVRCMGIPTIATERNWLILELSQAL